MKEEILNHIGNAAGLERLYQNDPEKFAEEFSSLLPEIKNTPAADFWSARLNYLTYSVSRFPAESDKTIKDRFNLAFTIAACLFAGFIVKIPQLFGFSPEIYYLNNLSFIVLPLFIAFYLYRNKPSARIITLFTVIFLVNVIYMNLLPGDRKSDTHVLASVHMVLFTWLIWGIVYVDRNLKSDDLKLRFIKRNGDILVLSAVILSAGVLLTGLTFGLFSLIKINIHKFYFEYVVMVGCASAPLVANYMIETSPKLISKVAPFVAKIFTPLVLISITCFLIALIFVSNDPFNNREELMTYNFLLIAVLAIIVFAFSGQEAGEKSIYNKILLILSLEAITVNCVALSAIIYRIVAFGITPNRLAVMGANILMFTNLIFIAFRLLKYVRMKATLPQLKRAMVMMFPYYLAWTIFITFVFPFVFWFK